MELEIKNFIDKITQKEVDNWWNSDNIETLTTENTGEKYFLKKDEKSVPFKKGLRALAEYNKIQLGDFSSNDSNRNNFCQKFNFEIDELLIYNHSEKEEFENYYEKEIKNESLFQFFIDYCNEVMMELDFLPYHVRMALSQNHGVFIVVSMRLILSYKENGQESAIRFIIDKSDYDSIKNLIGKHDLFDFKGSDNKTLIRLFVNSWNEIPIEILASNKTSVQEYYQNIKSSKLISWNTEASTTNSFVKEIIFKNNDVRKTIKSNKMANSERKQFLTALMRAVRDLLEHENHPLFRHEWVENNAHDYRQISLFEKGKEPNITLIHYEFMVRSNSIYIELHAEGNKENKDKWIPLINEIGSVKHKLISWKHGFKGKDPDKKYKKVQSNNFVELPDNLEVTEDFAAHVAEIFKSFYADCHPKLVDFYDKISPYTLETIVFEDYKDYLLSHQDASENSADYRMRTAKTLICKVWNSTYGTNLLELNYHIDLVKKIYSFKDQNFSGDFRGKGDFFNFIDSLINKDNTTKMALNTILYGPPGTGKTYKLQHDYFDKFTTKTSAISKDEYYINNISEYKWWEVIGAAVLDLGKAKVSDILEHPLVKYKTSLSDAKNVRASMWGTLQSHTVEDCELVNYKSRQAPLIFNKLEDSHWEFVEDATEEVPQIVELLAEFKNFAPAADTVIKRYKFVTFHQSYSYEEFIEGIKPLMENNDLAYEIKDGLFKEMCDTARKDPNNPYAIFIDEINRGNVASIFGELITLIEVDKRSGAKNEMSLTLPYSGKPFSVPNNLYIIGTMNTADRSVEALDTALRRRFSFVEMLPKPEVLNNNFEGIDLSKVLTTINNRIELLIDRDHTIGHSYFMNLKDLGDLASAFNDKIVPLLQEYFYGDYGKIGLVLGGGFVEIQENKDKKFSGFEYEGKSDFITPTFKLLPVDEDSVLSAIETLLETGAK